jgi:hypothetical protein
LLRAETRENPPRRARRFTKERLRIGFKILKFAARDGTLATSRQRSEPCDSEFPDNSNAIRKLVILSAAKDLLFSGVLALIERSKPCFAPNPAEIHHEGHEGSLRSACGLG